MVGLTTWSESRILILKRNLPLGETPILRNSKKGIKLCITLKLHEIKLQNIVFLHEIKANVRKRNSKCNSDDFLDAIRHIRHCGKILVILPSSGGLHIL